MVYCMADIHGEYDRYKAMLDAIRFSEQDTLYILGDVIDRNPNGVDILLDIIDRPNVKMLLGNHEQLCIDDLHWHVWGARQLWHQNGGADTRRDLVYIRPETVRKRILTFLRSLPVQLNIEVKGHVFHLVHGFLGTNKDDILWGRPDTDTPAPFPGATVIVGHTPTVYLNGDDGHPFRIWHGDGIIGIDCGCGNQTPLRRLACLRLDDMAEFYV